MTGTTKLVVGSIVGIVAIFGGGVAIIAANATTETLSTDSKSPYSNSTDWDVPQDTTEESANPTSVQSQQTTKTTQTPAKTTTPSPVSPNYTYTPPPTSTYTYTAPTYTPPPDNSACYNQKASDLAGVRSQETQVQHQLDVRIQQVRAGASGGFVTDSQLQTQIANASAPYQSQLSDLRAQESAISARKC